MFPRKGNFTISTNSILLKNLASLSKQGRKRGQLTLKSSKSVKATV